MTPQYEVDGIVRQLSRAERSRLLALQTPVRLPTGQVCHANRITAKDRIGMSLVWRGLVALKAGHGQLSPLGRRVADAVRLQEQTQDASAAPGA